MQPSVATRQGPSPSVPGVIDTIAAGLTIALAQPLLMTVPVLLDLYYWIGWRLTVPGLTAKIRQWLDASGSSEADSINDTLNRLGQSDATELISLFVPSLLAAVPREDVYTLGDRPIFAINNWALGLLAIVALIVLMAGAYMLYMVILADAALERTRSVRATARAVAVAWLRFLGLLALITALFTLVLGPPAFLWTVMSVLGIGFGAILVPMMVVAGIVMTVLLIFTPEAIAVAEVGPLRAIYLSFNVVRQYVWQTLALLLASLIITSGLGELWERLANTPPGLLTAVIANAFFAGGLTVAGMIFFNDRLRAWRSSAAGGRQDSPTTQSKSDR